MKRLKMADEAPKLEESYFARPKKNIKFIRSGCKTLDLALGGGWARRRISNIVGDKSSGKTLLCIEAAANFAAQVKKGRIRYREAEAAFDERYAQALGMPLDRVDFGEPMETVEDLFDDLTKIIAKSAGPELLFVDSLDALSTRAELDRDIDAATYGQEKAKMMSQLFRRLVRELEAKDVTLIIVSQVRDKINAVSFGRNTTRAGGRALDFYCSQVVYLASIGRIKKTVSGIERAIGVKTMAKIDKNKIAMPFREAEFQIRFGYGIDDAQACVDFLKKAKALKAAGIKENETGNYLNYMLSMTEDEAAEEMKLLHEVVEQKWYEIEGKMLTPRTKYRS